VHESEAPRLTAVLSIRDRLQTQVFLKLDHAFDVPIFERAQIFPVACILRGTPSSVQKRFGAKQATDMVGSERGRE